MLGAGLTPAVPWAFFPFLVQMAPLALVATELFARLERRPTCSWPLLAALVAAALTFIWFFDPYDNGWLSLAVLPLALWSSYLKNIGSAPS